jgi:hypothetical protein
MLLFFLYFEVKILGTRCSFSGDKAAGGGEADNSPPYNDEVKE